MAKKKRPSSRSRSSAGQSLVVQQPITAELLIETPAALKLDSSITMQDITDVAVSEREENLILEKETIEGDLAGARKHHAELEQLLSKAGDELLKQIQSTPEAEAACAALKAFSGKEYGVHVDDGQCLVKTATVSATVNIALASNIKEVVKGNRTKQSWGSSYLHEVDEITVTLPFTAEMNSLVEQLAASSAEIQAIDKKLDNVRRRLADLPRLQRRVKAEIVKATLRGDAGTGKKILETIMGVQPKALPFVDLD